VNNVEPPHNNPNGLPVIVGIVTVEGAGAETTIIERAVFTVPLYRGSEYYVSPRRERSFWMA
jgi:hypothetical protein